MLKITVFEFILRALPEAFLLMFSMSCLCNISIKANKYILSSLLLATSEYVIRRLPINYGVHTILNIIVMILILTLINGVDVIITIKSAMISTIILFICEAINMMLLNLIFNNSIEKVISNEVLKTVCGIPSLVIFIIINGLVFYIKRGHKHANSK